MIQTLDLPLSALGSRHKGFQSVASDWTNGFQNLKLIEEIRENLLGASAGFDFEATLAIQSIASICSSKVSKMRGKFLFSVQRHMALARSLSMPESQLHMYKFSELMQWQPHRINKVLQKRN